MPWHQITIKNRQELKLSALLCEADSQNKTDNPIVIVCHGFTGTKEGGGRALEMGKVLAAQGFNTLLFDFRGCGESEGSWEDITLSGQVEDLRSAAEWCRENGFARIILNGRSFGGTTAVAFTARAHFITALCTWAAVARPEALFRQFARSEIEGPASDPVEIEGEGEVLRLKKGFFYDLQGYNLLQDAAAMKLSTFLVIHGSADEAVPAEEAKLLFQAAKNPKELALIPGADHRFTNHVEQVWNTFFRWLGEI